MILKLCFTILVEEAKNICQYNEDCPPNKYCDRLNRQCINPCVEFDCGENTKCISSNHEAQCTCLPGYQGNPHIGCQEIPISDPCVPSPCGLNALCENDNGNPVCFCPKGLTGNPFEQCSMYKVLPNIITILFMYTPVYKCVNNLSYQEILLRNVKINISLTMNFTNKSIM